MISIIFFVFCIISGESSELVQISQQDNCINHVDWLYNEKPKINFKKSIRKNKNKENKKTFKFNRSENRINNFQNPSYTIFGSATSDNLDPIKELPVYKSLDLSSLIPQEKINKDEIFTKGFNNNTTSKNIKLPWQAKFLPKFSKVVPEKEFVEVDLSPLDRFLEVLKVNIAMNDKYRAVNPENSSIEGKLSEVVTSNSGLEDKTTQSSNNDENIQNDKNLDDGIIVAENKNLEEKVQNDCDQINPVEENKTVQDEENEKNEENVNDKNDISDNLNNKNDDDIEDQKNGNNDGETNDEKIENNEIEKNEEAVENDDENKEEDYDEDGDYEFDDSLDFSEFEDFENE